MTIEGERGENIANPDFVIIGQGNIGEKARQLVAKTPALKTLGFHVPRRTILAQGYFDNFFQRNRLGANLREVIPDMDIVNRIKTGSLPLEDFRTLQRVCLSYGSIPLIVRSSAEGDARGTGIYSSELSENNAGLVRKALQKVLASYFSKSAIAFRKDAQTSEGFGIIIEPVVGQQQTEMYEDGVSGENFFAPVLSGFGYTSTLRSKGYINVVPGLGGGVDTKDGLEFTKASLAKADGNLFNYILGIRRGQGKKDKPLLAMYTVGRIYTSPTKYLRGGVEYKSMGLFRNKDFTNLSMLPFFEMMSRMETVFGKPQYFEWAMTIENGKPKYWILQIADVNKKIDNIDFEDYGQVLFMAHTVTGSGIRNCNKIATCWNISDIEALNKFNKKNKGYILIYSSRLTTSNSDSAGNFKYEDFSNAGVLLEIQDAPHSENPVSHFGGQVEVTRKLFGVLDYHAEVPPDFEELRLGQHDEEGLKVYEGEIKVVASEKKDKMVLYI